ncbi:MAG: hypothetical protein RLN75_00170 [Longimicrobiales bacterium]
MKFLGYGVGVVWVFLVLAAFGNARAGAAAGQPDVAFWWSVIGGLLAIATLGAFIGTTIHIRTGPRPH